MNASSYHLYKLAQFLHLLHYFFNTSSGVSTMSISNCLARYVIIKYTKKRGCLMKEKKREIRKWVFIASALFLLVVLLFASYYYLFLRSRPNSNNQSDNFTVDGENKTDQLNNNSDSSNNTANNNNFDNKGEESSEVPAVEQSEAITFYEQGNSLYSQKKPEEAIVYYNRAIQANPYYPVVYNKKAQVLYELNRKNEALDTLLKGLEHNPDDPQLLSTYEIINAK